MFPAEPVPDRIGSYKILRRLVGLAATGPAEVYLARNEGPMGFERECELKLMDDTSEGNREFAEELAREAAICARMNHPAVVRVFDFFEHEGKLVLALEHIDGTTLAELMAYLPDAHQKLADVAVYYIGARIAGAIGDAHAFKDEHGNATPIIHRNLSPECVMISTDGEVRLSGFGVGKILGRTPDTAFGRIKGVPGFMAPEQTRGEPVTPKSDVYGLGVLLWSLLAWTRPPTDGTWPRRISGIRGDLPKEVAALVDTALDPFPGTRKITARELEQWLSRASSAAKGKAELRDKVALLRKELGNNEPEAPPPSSRRRISSVGSPYQGVRFGPAPATKGPPPKSGTPAAPAVAARRAGAAPPLAPKSHVVTATGMGNLALNLPPPPPAGSPARGRGGAPPPRGTPAPPPTAPRPEEGSTELAPASPAPAPHEATLPSRALVATLAVPPDALAEAPALAPPAAPRFGTPALLAPVFVPGAAPATPAPSSIRFGAPPAAPTPAPASIVFGPPPAATPRVTPEPAPVATPVPALVATPLPASAATPQPAPVAPPPPPRPRAPLPSLLTISPGRRSLSAMGAMLVSAVTALVVVSLALYAFVRRERPSASPTSASASAPSLAAAPPVASATAPAPASPSVSASTNAADLPYGYGYLTVVSPANANVFVSGKLAGPVNKPLKVRCGRWFIRLAAPLEGRYPEWVSPGETVLVACQEATTLDMGGRRP